MLGVVAAAFTLPVVGIIALFATRRNLRVEWHKAKQNLAERWKRVGEQITDLPLPVVKKATKVVRFGLAWAPFWMVTNAAGVSGLVPAYR